MFRSMEVERRLIQAACGQIHRYMASITHCALSALTYARNTFFFVFYKSFSEITWSAPPSAFAVEQPPRRLRQ